jgi:hypothetical protein
VPATKWSIEQHGFRALYQQWWRLGEDGLREVLLDKKALAQSRAAMQRLDKYRAVPAPRESGRRTQEEWWDSWELYALSRLNDLLLFLGGGVTWVSVTELRIQFFTALGFEAFADESLRNARIEPFPYSPFHHEIVDVLSAEEGDGVEAFRVEWPGLRWGNLMFARAGVSVRAPPSLIDPFVAERSVLYFAFRRYGRRTSDLSMGWGHNSQWATQFHCFYEDADHYYFNVDGSLDLTSAETLEQSLAQSCGGGEREDLGEDLPLACRRELLIHRHFVTCRLPDKHLWPWEDTLKLPKT